MVPEMGPGHRAGGADLASGVDTAGTVAKIDHFLMVRVKCSLFLMVRVKCYDSYHPCVCGLS